MPSAQFTPRVVRANRRHDFDRDIRIAHHGWFFSPKRGENIPYRGTLAFDFLTVAEAHPRVVGIEHKTDPVEWWNGSTWITYYPRYSLQVRTGRRDLTRYIDVEVMSAAELRDDRLRMNRIRRECLAGGRQFMVFTERQCRVQPRLTNCKFILQHSGEQIASEEDRALIRQIAIGTRHFTLNQVVETGVLTYPRAYSAVLSLVGLGDLTFPLGRRFDGDSVIRRRVGA